MRITVLTAAIWLSGLTLFGQTQPPVPAFEVASIRPSPPLDPAKIMAGKMHIGLTVDAARWDIGFASLADLIRIAYNVKPYQVTGPDWMSSQRFDITAKMPDGATKEQAPAMLQALLAERFKLTVHRDSKEQPVFALVVGKGGPKMKEVAAPAPAPAADGDSAPSKPGVMVLNTQEGQMKVERNSDGKGATVAGGPFGQMKMTMGEGGMMQMQFARLTMTALAEILTRFTEKPVVDMTELKGSYEVALSLSMEDMKVVARAAAQSMGMSLPEGGGRMGGGGGAVSPADAASTPSGTSIMSAVQQLGLKLEPRKSPLEMVVVDHLEKIPTEN